MYRELRIDIALVDIMFAKAAAYSGCANSDVGHTEALTRRISIESADLEMGHLSK
jgi:hypothetical protein